MELLYVNLFFNFTFKLKDKLSKNPSCKKNNLKKKKIILIYFINLIKLNIIFYNLSNSLHESFFRH
jgi:hypothetical protein